MKNDGGSAFPFPSGPEPRVNEFHERSEGMSQRVWLASVAMHALLLASHERFVQAAALGPTAAEDAIVRLSSCAYAIADIMLKTKNHE